MLFPKELMLFPKQLMLFPKQLRLIMELMLRLIVELIVHLWCWAVLWRLPHQLTGNQYWITIPLIPSLHH